MRINRNYRSPDADRAEAASCRTETTVPPMQDPRYQKEQQLLKEIERERESWEDSMNKMQAFIEAQEEQEQRMCWLLQGAELEEDLGNEMLVGLEEMRNRMGQCQMLRGEQEDELRDEWKKQQWKWEEREESCYREMRKIEWGE